MSFQVHLAEDHAAYWRERIAGLTDEELSKWVDGIAQDKLRLASGPSGPTRWICLVDDELLQRLPRR